MQRASRRSVLKRTGAAGIALGIAGCLSADNGNGGGGDDGGGNGGSQVNMTIASSFEPGHILVEVGEMFKKQIEGKSDGAFTVNVQGGGSYGAEDEIGELAKDGGVEAHTAGTFPFFQYAPKYFSFANPFVMDSYDKLSKLLESEKMQPAYEKMKQNGNQRALGQQVYRGFRHFTANEPIRTPEDVQGLNVRLPELNTWVQVWEHIGVDSTPVALDELYSALETGTADASEGPAEQIHSFKLSEVQSHYSKTSHLIETGNLYMNEDFYQGLDQTHKDLVDEVAQDVTKKATQTAQDREEKLISNLSNQGMTIVEDVDIEAFRDAGAPEIERLFENKWALSWDEVRNP
ncbi:TRAP transporter substrate-binding protein DctP [Halegenticoccus tardaugens]|uniref:TRAP transporter substrate-binding protein DctP n=1 Tax=Halegenticoccus tardaugens TaxID=2071624 RepID=UPI00100ABA63|nr:TRAP transporter substrate-binding protein DctP [Halegenticoccus tardaugens]